MLKSPSGYTLSRVSKHRAATLELPPDYGAQHLEFWADDQIYLFFLPGQNFCVDKKGCGWRNLDIWQLCLRLLSFSVMK